MSTSRFLLAALVLAPLARAQTALATLDGNAGTPRFGADLVRFHDLDGDGWREFLVGSPGLGAPADGQVVVLSGRFLAQGTPPAVKAILQGPTNDCGTSLIDLGDLDGNGVWDLAVGAPDAVVGAPFGFEHGAVLLFDATGAPRGQIVGVTAFERMGASMALLGDLNGDGVKDLLVGSPDFTGGIPSVPSCGKAAIYSGAAALQGLVVVLRAHLGEVADEHFGTTVATGFFDGDAVIDYAIGTPRRASPGGAPDGGRVSVYSGATGALIRTLYGAGGARFGASLSSGLDVTGDGVHDLAVGAPGAASVGAESGSVFVYSGAALVGGGLVLPTHLWNGPLAGAHFGASVELVQDLNGDGDADIAVGAPDYSYFPLALNAGQMSLFSGETGELLGRRTGAPGEHLGGAFCTADPWDGALGWEFLVGSPASAIAGPDTGRVSSWSIYPNTPTTYCTAQQNSQGCTPGLSGLGQPSATFGVHFNVRASDVLNNVPGILIYAFDAGAKPYNGGYLCVALPPRRMSVQFSGGAQPPAIDCSGSLTFDFNHLAASGADPQLVAGQEVFCQVWSRDTASPSGTNLTGGLRFLIHP